MRENCTYGSMRDSRRKTAKSVLRVVEDRAGVPDNKGRPALLYTLSEPPGLADAGRASSRKNEVGVLSFVKTKCIICFDKLRKVG